jgi:acyl carrier protein
MSTSPTAGGGRKLTDTADPDQIRSGIRELWRNELGRSDFADADDIFDLGASSLHAARVAGAIAEAYSVEVPLELLFVNPTVDGLTKVVLARSPSR